MESVKERKSTEYTEGDLADLVFWSFYLSQGASHIQRLMFQSVMRLHPDIISSAHAWARELSFSKKTQKITNPEDNPAYRALLERVAHFRNGKAHSRDGAMVENTKVTLNAELATFLHSAHSGPKSLQKGIWKFLTASINRERELLEREDIVLLRKKRRMPIGGSMVCAYGLSKEREEYRKILPPAYRKLWELAGRTAVINAKILKEKKATRFETYGQDLSKLTALFEAQTGERIEIPGL